MLEEALRLLRRGFSVFPCATKRQPLVDWAKYQTQPATEEEVVAWWTEHPDAMVAVALGEVSGVVRLDADSAEALARIEKLGGVPKTAEWVSPSGGRGWLFLCKPYMFTTVLWQGAGAHSEVRLQAKGAYSVLPPSPGYQWVRDDPVVEVPPWIRDAITERVVAKLEKELRPTLRQLTLEESKEALDHIDPESYDTWVQVGMALKSLGEENLEAWVEWSKKSDKFVEGECERKWATFTGSGISSRSLIYFAKQNGWSPKSKHEPITELGNARILARQFCSTLKHSSKWGWLAWDSRRWIVGADAEKRVVEAQKVVLADRMQAAVKSLVEHLQSPPGDDFDATKKRKLRAIQQLSTHEDERHFRGARSLAESEKEVTVDYNEFDTYPLSLNCANGTLDLRTLELRPHDSAMRLTQVCPVDFSSAAECPLFLDFLAGVLPDAGVREFMHYFLGCCLTGDTTPQIMPVFYGSGSNGKSTLIDTILCVLGEDYAMKAKRNLLIMNKGSEHPTSIARLYRKRFVACVETGEDARFDEALVKDLTGGDKIAARRMREDEWEFDPTHKIVLATNHKPEVRGTDFAIWRRLPLVPFEQRFEGSNRIPDLKERLLREAPGILLWMAKGAQAWLDSGKQLPTSAVISQATDEYRNEQDRVGAFIAEKCSVGDGKRARMDKIVEAYTVFCSVNRYKQMTTAAFGKALTERGFLLEAPGSKYRTRIELLNI